MAITQAAIDLLNNKFGSIAKKVGLGTLIQGAETGAPADGSITAAKLAADAVSDASKIADDAVSLEHLDAGITPSHIVVAAGKFTTAGGDANESITVAGVVATDVVHVTVQDGTETVISAKAGTGSIAVVMTDDPSTTHVLCYSVLRAVA